MNEVYLEGTVAAIAKVEHQAEDVRHVICKLRVTHRNREHQIRQELYSVNAWARLAEWVEQNMKPGMHVCVKGYLTQCSYSGVTATEVTASRFLIAHGKPAADVAQHDLPIA